MTASHSPPPPATCTTYSGGGGLEPTFAHIAPGDVFVETVRTWLAEAQGQQPTSTQRAKAYPLLCAIQSVAVDDEKFIANPCRIRGADKETFLERPVATPEQVRAIVEAIDDQHPDWRLSPWAHCHEKL